MDEVSTLENCFKEINSSFHENSYARGILVPVRSSWNCREVIQRGADQLGWDLAKLLTMTLQAMADSEDEIQKEMEAEEVYE